MPHIITLILIALVVFTAPNSAALTRPATETIPELPFSPIEDKPSTITAAGGDFYFAGLQRGTHQLYLDPTTLPARLRPPASAPQVSLWINPGQSLVSDLIGDSVRFSARYNPDGTAISGAVFLDQNGNGQRDPGEPGLDGVTVIDPTVHQYFVPFDDDDLWTLFAEINDPFPAGGGIGQCLDDSITSTDLNSFLSVTASSDRTIFYYDHWEDGYDADPLVPGASTRVGIIDAGVTRTFNNVVATPRLSNTLLYDGRDRITVFGEPASVIRAVYPITLGVQSGEVLAGAWEVPEVSSWGQSFVAVIGEDLDFNGPGVANDFDYVGLQIMAAQENTQVWLDGALVTTLETGETWLIDGENNGLGNGGIDSNTMITATGPIQVQMLGAACDSPWSARAFTLQPRDKWNHDYWAPVPDFEESAWCDIDQDGAADDRDTDLYLHNPHTNPITVTLNDGGMNVPLNIPPQQTISVLAYLNAPPLGRDLNNLNGAHLYSDQEFWGLSTIDSISGNSATDSTSNYNDWGYSLIPVAQLSSQVVLGWSPGNSIVPPTGDENGSLAFVTALTDTVVYVDFTQDGQPDAFDINGDGDANDLNVFTEPNFDEPTSDDGIPLVAGQVLRVADPNDNDLTGAMIYTTDLGAKIAVAWGQDPCRARPASPFLDLGYTVLPHPIPSLAKQDMLAEDNDGSGDVTPGDVLQYTLLLHNNGKGPLLNAVITDTLPYTYTDFIVGSLDVSQPPVLGNAEYFDGNTWGYTPTLPPGQADPAIQALRLTWPTINAGQLITITFRVLLHDHIPPNIEEISNQAAFCAADNCASSEDPDDPGDPDTDAPIGQPILQIDKIDEPDPVHAGELLTYTIVTTNTGNGTALGVLVLESLPAYTTYVSDTLDLTLPSVLTRTVTRTVPYTTTFTGSYADDFDLTVTQTTDYDGSDGTLPWAPGWNDLEDNDPIAGDVQVGSMPGDELSPAGYLELTDTDDFESGVTRLVDLTDFVAPTLSFYVWGDSDAGDDTYDVRINGASQPGFPEQHNDDYEQRTLDLSAYAGLPAVTLEFWALATMEAADAYRIDNINVTEASPLRSGTRTLENITSTLVYTTYNDINPIAYDPAANTMTVTHDVLIPPGAQVSMSFQVRVAIPLTNGHTLLNTAAITSTNVVSRPYPLEDTEPTEVLSSHALTITKQASVGVVQPGDIFSYTLHWEVGGDDPAPGVVVTDTLPWPYVSFIGCEGGLGCTYTAPDTVVWELGDRLPPASGITYDHGWLTLTVQAEWPPPNGVFTNTVILDDATDVPPDEDDEPVRVITHTLNITKTDDPYDPLAPGETLTYTLWWEISGDGPAPDVTVTDILPSSYVSFRACAGGLSCGEISPGSGVVVWDLGDQLLGGSTYASGTLSLTVQAALPLTDGLTFSNTVILDDATDVPPAWDDETTTIYSSHVLTITKEDQPDTVYIGQRMTYTLFWKVSGDEPAPGLVVTDTLPWPYVSFVSCKGNCAYTAPDTVAWNLGDRLPPMSGLTYESGHLTLTVRVEGYPPTGVITNVAVIDDLTPVLPDEDQETTDVLDTGFILNKQRTLPDIGPAAVDDPVNFQIVITNTGSATLTLLPLEDTYDPTYLEFQSAQPSPDITETGRLVWNDLTSPPRTDLATGQSVYISVTFTAITSTQHLIPSVTINTATSRGAQAGAITLPPIEDEADIGIETGGPTAIWLLYLRANPRLGGVLIEWATLFEVDTYGFWLYRSADGQLSNATPLTFVAGQGHSNKGAAYQYLDTGLPSVLHHYWLVEKENGGGETVHGPVSAWPGLGYQIYLPLVVQQAID
jgi:uncharacterized repeat protein (TIGR01451 family)